MALEPEPLAVRTLGPSPKQVSMLWRLCPLSDLRAPITSSNPPLESRLYLGRLVQLVRFTPSCWSSKQSKAMARH